MRARRGRHEQLGPDLLREAGPGEVPLAGHDGEAGRRDPRDCGTVPLEGPAAGALACPADFAPAAALGAARAAPPAVEEAADSVLEPRLMRLSP